uniref:DUF668 domain-containing protein n=1 Tax=Araucaria cunninghamii TaxID=56994 RepID=A0A0D6QRF8_ARACU
MVLESWLNRLGSHVSHMFTTAVKRAGKHKAKSEKGAEIGVLAFEVANLMSKLVQLWKSLSDQEIVRMRAEVITLPGVRKVVSNDDNFLLGLACAEKLDNLTVLAEAVARLGKKCKDTAMQGFEHVYDDLLCNKIDVRGLVFSLKDMEAKIKKMEKYISATTNLYQELEVLADLEQTFRRVQGGDEGTRGKDSLHSVQQKVNWQRQEIKYLREISLWNRTYDAVVGLLARAIFTICSRIRCIFGAHQLEQFSRNGDLSHFSATFESNFPRSLSVSASGPYPVEKREIRFASGPLQRCPIEMNSGRRSGPVLNRLGSNKVWQDKERHSFVGSLQSFVIENGGRWGSHNPDGASNGGSLISFSSKVAQGSCNINLNDSHRKIVQSENGFHPVSASRNGPGNNNINTQNTHSMRSLVGSKFRLLIAPSSTLGGAALALHYANVIIVIEKLVRFPQLIGPDARDDLYQMLPTSVRVALKNRLRSCAKNIAPTMYNAALAADWSDALDRILEWLAPLAHNMIRWQSERNFEQQHLVPRTNVLLLQTLYFANQVKTELAITELLVGLNYICRYEQEIRANAMMECTNHDYDEYLEWSI